MSSAWTDEGRREIGRIAGDNGFPEEAGFALAAAIAAGGGSQAQFSHPALGGMGQWSQGGMLMIGDMFNDGLKSRVRRLADDLADALRSGAVPREQAASAGGADKGTAEASAARWWPEDLGSPASSGAQNGQRYAVFPDKRRLVLERNGRVTVHDTGDHRIGGASQQQGGASSLRFSSQLGPVAVEELPEVEQTTSPDGSDERWAPAGEPSGTAPNTGSSPGGTHNDVLETIAKLADLRDRGILSQEEFAAKKADLLGRL